jgi:hypothetical protein
MSRRRPRLVRSSPEAYAYQVSAGYGAQHACTEPGGTREARLRSPPSGHGMRYKPMAKSSAAQRESEGIVVVTMAATNNAVGAKGPCGGHVGRAATHEGMTGRTGSNHPDGLPSVVQVRHLQRSLWCVAKPCSLGTTPRAKRPPVSRVREIRTHGLNGGLADIRSDWPTDHK